MRAGRLALASLIVAALLLSGGAPVFCTPAGHGMMKCCSAARGHGQGMKRPDCCRFVPAPPGQTPAGVQADSLSNLSRDEIKAAASADPAQVASLEERPEAQASPLPLPVRELSVPLYLRNTSLLR